MSSMSFSPQAYSPSPGGSSASAIGSEELAMPTLYLVGGVVSLAILVYLFVALLKPESLS
jgi:K+-transporting ATPase KdpF subunit